MSKHLFPKNFLWGASTSAHQVEGDLHNQWTEWEQTNARDLAASAKKRYEWLPNWQHVESEATSPLNYISGHGVAHYKQYKSDFALLKKLHMNAFRFGIEWSRLEPNEGGWDEQAVEHYRRYIAELKQLNIEPILTLWHWTMPVWFNQLGGFEKRQNIAYFERFVSKIASEFGSELRYVLTINEPNVYASFSYMIGEWPPQRHNPLLGLKVYNNLRYAHNRAYTVLKTDNPELLVGMAANLGDVRPTHPHNPLNRLTVSLFEYGWNWWFVDHIKAHLDFIGLNYYFTEYRDSFGRQRNPKQPVSDLGWYMEPSGIQAMLEKVWKRYHKPVVVVENGLADASDTHRQWWLEQTLSAMEKARKNGVQLFGYLHWSLFDNFEWAFGWWPKFGLIAVDRATMLRTIRPSAQWFGDQIKNHRS